jgi:hypothetical protein
LSKIRLQSSERRNKKTVKLAQAHSLLLLKKKIEEEEEEDEVASELLAGGPSTWDSS